MALAVGPLVGLLVFWLTLATPPFDLPLVRKEGLAALLLIVGIGSTICLVVQLAVIVPLLLGLRRYQWRWVRPWTGIVLGFALGALPGLCLIVLIPSDGLLRELGFVLRMGVVGVVAASVFELIAVDRGGEAAGRQPTRMPLALPMLAIVVVALIGGAVVWPHIRPKPSWEPRPGLKCPLSDVDFKALGPTKASDADGAVRTVFRERKYGPLPSIALWSFSGMSRSELRVVAQRSADGAWMLSGQHVSPHQTPNLRMISTRLTADEAAKLGSILSDPCFYAEPELVGREYPDPHGEKVQCMDGSDILLDVDIDGKRRRSVQACSAHGLTGEVGQILTAAASRR